MFYNSSDYPKAQAYRNEKLVEAQHDHLANLAAPSTFEFPALRRARYILLALVIIVIVAALPGTVGAQDRYESGDNEPFAEAITAYRVGHYYYVAGKYDRAIAEYTQAIAGIPAEIFSLSADYAVMYWDLGDALLMAGQYEAALGSYQHFIELMNGGASDKAVDFVAALETAIVQGAVELKPIIIS